MYKAIPLMLVCALFISADSFAKSVANPQKQSSSIFGSGNDPNVRGTRANEEYQPLRTATNCKYKEAAMKAQQVAQAPAETRSAPVRGHGTRR